MKRLTVNKDSRPVYDILIDQGTGKIGDEIRSLGVSDRKVMAVFDSNTEKYWKDEVIRDLTRSFAEVHSFTFTAGEASKNLDTVEDIYEALIKANFERKDFLAAVGGGVCGDMTGFAAATYLRGIRFIQVPTTLLAMCDSSVGGKTGVDFRAYKNMVGAFCQPSLVYMNMNTLKTLPDREFLSGMGEVIKYGYIRDADLLKYVACHAEAIRQRDFNALSYIVGRSCELKRQVVEEDPTEKGIRAILNFGHTIGHAIEKLMNFKLLHGECVAIGMVAAARISAGRGFITEADVSELKRINSLYGLPVSVSGLLAADVLRVTKSDKKMEAGRVKFILISKIGEAVIDHTVTDEELLAGINEVLHE